MMMTWLVMGWAAHIAFTKQARKVVFQSEDETRAIHGVDCCKELWRNSMPELIKRWPLVKDVDKQAFSSLELSNQSQIVGIPGNPDKIRSEHPSIIVFDEACHMTEFGESYGVAINTRTPKMVALSSANVGAFRDSTRMAKTVPWPEYSLVGGGMTYPCPGLSMRRTADGIPVIKAHYSADPDLMKPPLVVSQYFKEPIPHQIAELRSKNLFGSQSMWDREMEIKYEAMDGAQIYPEWDESIHIIPDDQIPTHGSRFMAIDPHPRTPHAALWVLIDKWNDWYFYREHWPSIVRGNPRKIRDDEQENTYTVWMYVEAMAWLEGNEIEWRHANTERTYGIYRPLQGGERIDFRLMDQAAKGFQVSAEGQQYETIATRYSDYGLVVVDPKKAHTSGEDAVRAGLAPRKNDMRGKSWPRFHFAESLIETRCEFPLHRYKVTRRPNDERDLKQDRAESRCHMPDLVRYLAVSDAGYHPSTAQTLERYRLSDGTYQWARKAA